MTRTDAEIVKDRKALLAGRIALERSAKRQHTAAQTRLDEARAERRSSPQSARRGSRRCEHSCALRAHSEAGADVDACAGCTAADRTSSSRRL